MFTNNQDGMKSVYDAVDKKIRNEKDKDRDEKIREQEEKLNKLLAKQDSNQKTTKKSVLTAKQQLLLLHYTGLLPIINKMELSEQSKGILISLITDKSPKNSTDNLRILSTQNITVSDIQTRDNLGKVKKHLEHLGLSEMVRKIESDLEKLPID